MKTIMILMALLLSSCASLTQDNRSADRIVKVCIYNALVNWMSVGQSGAGLKGDAKKALDTISNAKALEGICYENEQTIKEDL